MLKSNLSKKMICCISMLHVFLGIAGICLTLPQEESFAKQVWGSSTTCGPCLTLDYCGGYGGGMGTCKWTDGQACVGNCETYCPEGADHKGCAGSNQTSCTNLSANCSTRRTFTCRSRAGAPSPSCWCEQTGTSGTCGRSDC
jgi:hypothetical protein